MKLYKHGDKEENVTVMVQPGIKFPDVEGWMTEERDDNGKMHPKPTMFNVQFKNWAATVDDNLGKFMLDNHYAERDPRSDEHARIEAPVTFNDVKTKEPIQLPV